MNLNRILATFEAKREQHLEDMMTFLRMETVSTAPEHAPDLQRCAEWLSRQMRRAGLESQILSTAGHPAIFADSGPVPDRPGALTLLFYGHYDVQPPGDLELWTSPPFEPTVRGGNVFARGSADDKGQVMTHLAALSAWHDACGSFPVRVKILIEGEEEIGSPHLPDLIQSEKERLACDYVVISDTSKHSENVPALTCSTRGLVYKEITVRGPERDLHSGQYGGTVANPANALAAILASLHDHRGRVTIPGFYDHVRPISDAQRARLAEHGMTDTQVLSTTGSEVPVGEEGYSSAERGTLRPSLDVNGLVSGFTGHGAATIIPANARAKVSMRLVVNQNPDTTSEAFDRAVRAACPPGARVEIQTHSQCAAYEAPEASDGITAASAALAAGYGREPVLAHEGGTLPILPLFAKVLGADSLMLGFAMPDCNLHSPDEFFCLRDFDFGTRCIIHLLDRLGRIDHK